MTGGRDAALEAERLRFADAKGERPAWFRFAPRVFDRDGILEAIEALLGRDHIVERLSAHDAAGTYPEDVINALRALGLLRLFTTIDGPWPLATAYHLSALDLLTARASASLAITVGVNCLALLVAYRGATPEQLRQILGHVAEGDFAALGLTELENGSDVASNRSAAEPGRLGGDGIFRPLAPGETPTHFRLCARFNLINGGSRHPLLFALLRTRAAGTDGDRWRVQSIFWIHRGCPASTGRSWSTWSAPAADISDVFLDDAVVEAGQMIGECDRGFAMVQETLAMSRGGVAALAAGTLSRARDLALSYARRRKMYGSSIGKLGALAAHAAKLDAFDRVTTALSLKAAAWVNACGGGAASYTAAAKFLCCRLAEDGITEGRHLLGARALLAELPYARLIGDVALFGVFDGTSHVMLEELQAMLAVQTRRWRVRPGGDADSLLVARRVYDADPRSLVDAARTDRNIGPVSLSHHASALANLPGEAPVHLVAALAEVLFAVCLATRETGAWAGDQQLRFDFAEVLAGVEGLVALVEIFDLDRRPAVMTRPPVQAAEDVAGYRHALAWVGGRVASQLAGAAASAGLAHLRPGTCGIGGPVGAADIAALFQAEVGVRRSELAKRLFES
jgi:alkylation response protein AidB-like acyl-CoA dehydrogenase